MTAEESALPTFEQFDLPPPLLDATRELGFAQCTEIQALTLPHILDGVDVAAQAQTGTGKTAAFLLGGMARLLGESGGERRPDQPRMVVIAPTRELAMQIQKDAEALGRHSGLRSLVVYGGIDYEKQRSALADGTDILIGTPGRLIDYFKQRIFDLKACEIAVLDEADRMFDLGFIADIRFLLRRMPDPERRQSMLFSATLSHRVMELAYEHMNNPRALKTDSRNVTADGVRQYLYHPGDDEKIPLLLGLLKDREPERAIVFVNTKRAAERVENYLVGNAVSCGTLSGDVRQKRRQKILADFSAGRLPILIATDVAARGLHIDDVTHVFNYDLPQQAEDYVHRIGRTARAGSEGEAVSFACEQYSFSLPEIETYIGRQLPATPITDELLVAPRPPARIERDRVSRPPRERDGRKSGRDASGGRGHRSSGGAAGRSRRSGTESPDRHDKGDSRARGKTSGERVPSATSASKPTDHASEAANEATPGTASGKKPPARRRRRRPRKRTDSGARDGEASA